MESWQKAGFRRYSFVFLLHFPDGALTKVGRGNYCSPVYGLHSGLWHSRHNYPWFTMKAASTIILCSVYGLLILQVKKFLAERLTKLQFCLMRGVKYLEWDVREIQKIGPISVSADSRDSWDMTSSARAVHSQMFLALNGSKPLTSFFTLRRVLASTSIGRWRKLSEKEVAIIGLNAFAQMGTLCNLLISFILTRG